MRANIFIVKEQNWAFKLRLHKKLLNIRQTTVVEDQMKHIMKTHETLDIWDDKGKPKGPG